MNVITRWSWFPRGKLLRKSWEKYRIVTRWLNHWTYIWGFVWETHERTWRYGMLKGKHRWKKLGTWEFPDFAKNRLMIYNPVMFHPPKDHVVFCFLFAGIKQHIMGVFNFFWMGDGMELLSRRIFNSIINSEYGKLWRCQTFLTREYVYRSDIHSHSIYFRPIISDNDL